MIQAKKLNKHYNIGTSEENIIFDTLDIEIKKGEFVAIIGSSGSGKTTFLNMVAGLIDFDSGSLVVNETELSKLDQNEKTRFRGQNISFIFQDFHLIDNLTVEENIDLIIDLNKLKRRYETSDILKKVGLENKAKQYPFNLSGGEQQRVAIARAFVGETPLLLADEPTGNLDDLNSDNIMKLIATLHKESGNTIAMITHDIEIAKQADTIYTLQKNTLKKTNV
ncbi:ABC transporter ATP-binding protein [Candidatus Gracilibacteria bacterium]|nr:ABC transporter ATP-binding protein [Candidatus Gracilibacteria bacterium]